MSRQNLSSGFPTRSNTNLAVQSQNMSRGVKFGSKKREYTFYVAKTKALISCAIYCLTQLICAFFVHAKYRFSRDVPHPIHCKSLKPFTPRSRVALAVLKSVLLTPDFEPFYYLQLKLGAH